MEDKLGLKAEPRLESESSGGHILLLKGPALFLGLSSQRGLTDRQIKVQADGAAGGPGMFSHLVWESVDRKVCIQSEPRGRRCNLNDINNAERWLRRVLTERRKP